MVSLPSPIARADSRLGELKRLRSFILSAALSSPGTGLLPRGEVFHVAAAASKLAAVPGRQQPGMGRAVYWVVLLCLAFWVAFDGRGAATNQPFGLEKRVPWTSSHLAGSPEPPLPCSVEKVFTNITWKAPISLALEPGTDRLLVVLQGGESNRPSRIVRIRSEPTPPEPELFLEVPRRLVYALTFHPRFESNRFVYVFSNGWTGDPERTNRISRFTVAGPPLQQVETNSEHIIIEWRSAGHDGGDLAFGHDGMLYITTGDGTADSDGWNSGQSLDDLLGSVLRIDVDHPSRNQPYSVPPDNPFVNLPGARGEIWAYGLRNPWRMSVDSRTGHLWVGNNGQDLWETAHLVRRGENYGWSVYEGSHPFYLNRKRGPTPIVKPTIEHPHSEFRSLTGGVVYYGRKFPDLNGAYIYGDYNTGRIWGMKHDGTRPVWHRELADTSLLLVAFLVDRGGELLIADNGGGIYRLASVPKTGPSPPFPTRLSDTGLFTSAKDHQTAPGLIPYSVNAPGWADGAEAERFMAVPGEERVGYDVNTWRFTNGTALLQTLSLERIEGQPASRIRLETRVLLRQQGEWAGYSYRWNEQQTDATLVPKEGAETELTIRDEDGTTRRQTWRFPSRTDCMVCHSRAANFVLGLNEAQMNRDHNYGGVRDNQLRALERIGFFEAALPRPPKELARFVDPSDAAQDLEARARVYLHVNCSVCHVAAGGGNAKMELQTVTARSAMNLLGARPQHDSFGIENAMLVAPGAPERSILLHRLSQRGRGQMPPVMTTRVDEQAVQLFRSWIAQLKPDKAIVQEWKLSDFLPLEAQVQTGRSFASGQTAFRELGCVQCHRLAGEGESVGPELTGVGRRLAPRDVLESILEPSKIIADEYAAWEIETTDGESCSGRIEREDERVLVVRPPSSGEKPIEIKVKNIRRRQRSSISNMPTGIVNVLQRDQVLDLLAYLLSDGDSKAAVFK